MFVHRRCVRLASKSSFPPAALAGRAAARGLILAALAGCSAGADAEVDGAPAFSGYQNPNLPGTSGGTSGAAGNEASSGGVAPGNSATGNTSTNEGTPGNVPISNTGAGAMNGSTTPGAGGTSGVAPGAMPPGAMAGAAGSAMASGGEMPPGTAGAAGSSSMAPPPVPPEPPVVGAGCGGSAFFCEDFDALPVGSVQAAFNGLRPERAVNIVDEPGRGRVLQVPAGSTYGNKNGVFLDNVAPPNNSHFGRAFIRVAQFPQAGGDHWVVVEATANDSGERVRPVGGQFSRWAPGSDGPSAGDWTDWAESDAETVGGAWECVEWQIDGANGANDMTLWVDGLEVRPLERGGFRLPAINTLWFGWVVFQAGQPTMFDVRFDDLVLSTERVGCD